MHKQMVARQNNDGKASSHRKNQAYAPVVDQHVVPPLGVEPRL